MVCLSESVLSSLIWFTVPCSELLPTQGGVPNTELYCNEVTKFTLSRVKRDGARVLCTGMATGIPDGIAIAIPLFSEQSAEMFGRKNIRPCPENRLVAEISPRKIHPTVTRASLSGTHLLSEAY